MLKVILTCVALATTGMCIPAGAQQTIPNSREAARIEVIVNKAAELVEKQGRAAFSQFRRRGTEWWFDDVYLFVFDMSGNILLNAAFPKREGTNRLGERDADGKLFHEGSISVVQSDGSGWVDYMFPKPGQNNPTVKWSYVRSVTIDGKPGLIGAGFYTE